MRFAVSHTIENAYWSSVVTLLNAQAGAGKALLYSGPVPSRGTAATVANTLIASFDLQKPAEASITGGVLTLASIDPATVLSSAAHTYAAFVDGSGAWVAHCDTGTAGSGAAWVWNAASYTVGGILVPTTLTLRFPA